MTTIIENTILEALAWLLGIGGGLVLALLALGRILARIAPESDPDRQWP